MEHSTATQDFTPSAIPPELRSLRQWVGWEYAKGKKRPLDPATGEGASTTDPETWGTFSEADALFKQVGFVFNEDDPYCGIDLDDCINKETGELNPDAAAVVSAVVLLGESLGRRVIVEGVEDAGTLNQLRKLGSTHVQGEYLSRAKGAVDLTPELAQQPWLGRI